MVSREEIVASSWFDRKVNREGEWECDDAHRVKM